MYNGSQEQHSCKEENFKPIRVKPQHIVGLEEGKHHQLELSTVKRQQLQWNNENQEPR